MKTNSYAVFFLAVLFLSAVTTNAASLTSDGNGGYYINMPKTGTSSLVLDGSVTTFKIYDDGGASNVYSAGANGYLQITANSTNPNVNYRIVLTGTLKTQNYANSSADNLTVYDGITTSSDVLLANAMSRPYHGDLTDIGEIASTGNEMMLYFKSNDFMEYDGLDLTVNLINEDLAHTININQKSGGTLIPNKTSSAYGEIITLSPLLDDGFLLNGIDAVDANGKVVKVNNGFWYGTATPSFSMPYSNVSVTPAYTDEWSASGGVYINLPKTGTMSVNIPSGMKSLKVYDDGGALDKYSKGSSSYLTLTAPVGNVLRVSGTIAATERAYSYLDIYDGTSSAEKLLDGQYSPVEGEPTNIEEVVSTGRTVTIYFYGSSYHTPYDGLDLTVELLETSTTHNITAPTSVSTNVSGNAAAIHTDVEFTVTSIPEGYLLTGVNVVADGKPIEVNGGTWSTGNKGSFKMPYSDVTITPVFANNKWTAADGLEAILPTNGTNLITIPDGVKSFKVYDDGGKDGFYGVGVKGSVVLTAPDNKFLKVSGSLAIVDLTEVTIFDGGENGVELVKKDGSDSQGGPIDIGPYYSTGKTLTIKFEDDDGYSKGCFGLDLTVLVVDPEEENAVNVSGIGEGTVVFDKSTSMYKYGDVVTVTVNADDGYFLADFRVEDIEHNAVAVTDVDGSTKKFTMPAGGAVVVPHFVNPKKPTFDSDGRLTNYTYFHMDCQNSVCLVSQKVVESSELDLNNKDFLYWNRGTMQDDAVCEYYPISSGMSGIDYSTCKYGLVDVFLKDYAPGGYSLKLADTLYFGGFDGSRCAMQLRPIPDENYSGVLSSIIFDGGGFAIDGLCQNAAQSGSNQLGFIYANSEFVSVSNVTFTNAYIVGGSTGDVGVVAGYAGGGIALDNVKIENSTVKGVGNVGGLVGYAEGSVKIENSSFAASENGSVSGTDRGSIVGGLIGNVKTTLFEVKESFVRGNVSSGSSVGGIAGNITRTANANKNISLALSYSYSIGDITTDVTGAKIGYLIGSIDSAVTDFNTVQYNYHYGFNDAQAELGIGSFSVNGWHNPELDDDATGDNTAYYVNRNIRNAVSGLDSDGDFTLHHYPINSIAGTTYNNGVVSSSAMKTKKFAALLNMHNDSWTQVDSQNDSLPFFATTEYKPIYVVTFDVNTIKMGGYEDQNKILEKAVNEGRYQDEYCGSGCYGLALFTDYTGKLNSKDLTFIDSLLDDESYWFDYSMGEPSESMVFNGHANFEYFTGYTMKVAYHICKGSVVLAQNGVDYECNGDTLAILPDQDIDGYDLSFVTYPAKEVSSSEFQKLIPRMIVKDQNGITTAMPHLYRIESKDAQYAAAANYLDEPTFDAFRLVIPNYYGDKYDNTLHLYYDLNKASSTTFEFNLSQLGAVPEVVYNAIAYDVNGKFKVVENVDIDATENMSLAAGFTVAVPAGYSLEEYAVELVHTTAQTPVTEAGTGNYFVTPDVFTQDYGSKAWKLTGLTAADTVRLDSVYKGMVGASAELNKLQMKVTPTIVLNKYTVKFDVTKEGYVILGNNWDSTKVMDVSSAKEFPNVYVMKDQGSSKLFVAAEWSPELNASANDPHASSLTSAFLERVNPPGLEFTLYPYADVARDVGEIRVIASDGVNDFNGLSDYHGSIKISQTLNKDRNFEQKSTLCATQSASDVYTHCLYLPPTADDTLTFKVSLVPESGYRMKLLEHSFMWQLPTGGNPTEPPAGFGYNETGTDTTLVVQPHYMTHPGMYFKVKYTVTGPFYVEYNLNTAPEDEDKLFLPVDAKKYDTLAYSETVVSHDLWQPYRTDKCFAGWYDKGRTVTAGSGHSALKSFDADYAASTLETLPDYPTEVYAIWEDCATAPATGITIANGNTNAEIMLKQVLDGDEYEHLLGKDAIALPANSSGYKFFIDSANSNVALGFEPGKVSAEYDMNGTRYEFAIEGDSIVVGKTNVSEYFITMETPVSLYQNAFWLNLNADTVFFGTTFMDLEVHAQKDESIPMDIYRVGYKLKGWSFENGSTVPQQPANLVYRAAAHQAFDTEFENDYAMYIKTYNRLPDTLYAVWEKDDAAARRIVNLSPDVSSFRLMQDIYGMGFDYLVSDTLLLPAEGRFNFIMEMLYDPNDIEVDNMHAIVILDENGEVQEVVENNTMQSVEKSIGLKANILKDKRVKFVLNENSEDTVFFGSDWTEELTSENPDSALALPTIVYNSEKCLAGWTLDSASNDLITVIDKNLLSDLRAKSKNMGVDISKLLYAKWTTNLDSCAGDFLKLALEQENGSVWFAESDKDKTIERRFTDEGTMFVPMELNGRNFRVQARGADTSVYVLDSLVVLRDGKIDTVLHEGDYMPEVLDNVTLKAYFGWKNKTEVAFKKVRLDSSGVMFRLNFKASDFEVRRIVSAKMQIFDAVKGSHVRTYDLGDTIAMGYDTSFVFHTDKTGEYKMVLSLKEEKEDEPKTFETKFSVSSKISAIAADGWQMLSLSAVDLSAVKNDGDQIFYWWDEHGTGEFWQYKKLNLKDSISPTLGVWYNSREGRELPLQKDIIFKDDDFVWKLDSVNTGWNMVANPYGWTLDLYANNPHAKKDFDEESEITFWRYNAGDWDPEPVTKILPYESVWAQVTKKKSVKWKVSAAPFFPPEAVALEKRALAKATTKDRWTLQAKLADMNGKRDSWNILGAGLNPVTADEPPEYMGDHVNLTIVEGKRALAKSIKTASDEMEWNVALSASSDRVGYLSFAGIDGVNAFGYRVFVTVDGNTTEMREGEPLKVYLKSSARMATVRVAPAAKMIAKNTIRGLRTARLGNRLRVTFDASGLVGTKARVDLLDLKGHVMSTVSGKTVDGCNALVLDAPQSGLYMLRVRAGSQQQAAKVVVQ